MCFTYETHIRMEADRRAMVNKWHGLFILSIPYAITRVVLLDDIDAPEKHGNVTIDSTNNKLDHISRKVRMKTSLTSSNIPYQKETTSRYITFGPPRNGRDALPYYKRETLPRPGAYSVEKDTSIKVEPIYQHKKQLNTTIDRRIEDLLSEIQKTKKEQDIYMHTQEDLNEKQARWNKLISEKNTTAQSIGITQKEIKAVMITLSELKKQLYDLTNRENNLIRDEKIVSKEIEYLQSQLNAKEALLHKLHKLKKKYKWLESEYNYYESDSSSD
ncbi:hypothetical protein NEIRO02_1453 [Nematocida sp. AWRm79]|nr:hypothetical protein NEIRO02_1453 [Nematocida sp. AWRm79]